MTDNLFSPDGKSFGFPPLPVLFLCLIQTFQISLCSCFNQVSYAWFLVSECKGSAFLWTTKIFRGKFSKYSSIININWFKSREKGWIGTASPQISALREKSLRTRLFGLEFENSFLSRHTINSQNRRILDRCSTRFQSMPSGMTALLQTAIL